MRKRKMTNRVKRNGNARMGELDPDKRKVILSDTFRTMIPTSPMISIGNFSSITV